MTAAPKPKGGGSPETAGTGGSGGTRGKREREGKGKRDIGVGCRLVVSPDVPAHGHFRAIRQANNKHKLLIDTATAAAATPRPEQATATSFSIPPTLDLIIQDQIYTRFKIKDGIRGK